MTFAEIIECTIDFEGQRLAEQLTHVLLTAFGVVSFAIGFYLQSIQMVMAVFAAGLVITALVVVPPWPMYRKHAQPFLNESVVEKKD
ncbi:hypothetical protein INT47_006039 [Mucor saturninus]|uniref:Signal peptidase complex subunit 1 n=1 Tax=Mucor saturninus TaxID=64648 RepID=A0A8H7QH59_9FUNG|nr:hypothetical protein INT47_006039 [Mucor saturninus]